MKELLVSLMLWIGANTSYSVDLSLPEVIRMDRAPLEYQYFQGKVPKNSDVHGFYNLKDKKIYNLVQEIKEYQSLTRYSLNPHERIDKTEIRGKAI